MWGARMSIRALDDLRSFMDWLVSEFGDGNASLTPGQTLDDFFKGDRLAHFLMLNELERCIGEGFPIDLVDACETVEDWYHFAVTKSGHRTST